jgi:ribonuclease PH
MTGGGRFIELQGTAEGEPFDDAQMKSLLRLARRGITRITQHQRKLLGGSGLLPQ